MSVVSLLLNFLFSFRAGYRYFWAQLNICILYFPCLQCSNYFDFRIRVLKLKDEKCQVTRHQRGDLAYSQWYVTVKITPRSCMYLHRWIECCNIMRLTARQTCPLKILEERDVCHRSETKTSQRTNAAVWSVKMYFSASEKNALTSFKDGLWRHQMI